MLRRTGPLAPAHASELVRQIADALHAAHHLGIVHRDLKPDNILITHDADGRERVKVVDFGIAKAAPGSGQTVTTTGMSVGTPEYMSPEQLSGESLDARSDIYSLGLVTFKMLTGELAYPDVTSKQSLVQRLTTRPRPLSHAKPDATWPPRLQEALDRAMSPEPHDRYGKVSDFALDVMAAAGTGAPRQGRTRAMTPIGVPGITTESYEVVDDRVLRRRPLVAAGGVIAAIGAIVLLWSSRTDAPVQGAIAPPPAPRVDSVPVSMAPMPQPSPPVAVESQSPPPAIVQTPPAVAAPTVAPPDSAATALDAAEEVLGHISRARRLIANGQLPRAGAEIRAAHEKFVPFAAEHPGTRETQQIGKLLVAVSKEALASCRAGRGPSAPAADSGRRGNVCGSLELLVPLQERGMRRALRPE
jgi:serine/threonine-protein kinase